MGLGGICVPRGMSTGFWVRSGWAVACAVALGSGVARADDWPQWRGLRRDGTSAEKGWKVEWPATGPKVAWKAQVGLGFSSVVVADGRAYTMGHAEEQDRVFCFDVATGSEVWRHSFASELGDKYFEGGTTGTPTVSGGRVYVLNRWGEAFCLGAADGKVVWHRNVEAETKAAVPDWGFTGAPLVSDGKVYLNVGDGGLALDAATGQVAWKSSTKSAGYSTPFPHGAGEKQVLILGTAQSYVAVRPKDGTEVWRVKWLTQYGVNAADPVMDGDRMFVSTGYGKGAALFRMGGGEPEMLWKSKALRTQMNPAVLHGGFLYGVDGDTTEKASLKCLEFATGTEKWSQPGFGSGGVIVVDGKLVGVNGTGELLVAPAVPDGFKPVARAQVVGGKTWTAPVLADGRVYVRNSKGDLVVVDVRP